MLVREEQWPEGVLSEGGGRVSWEAGYSSSNLEYGFPAPLPEARPDSHASPPQVIYKKFQVPCPLAHNLVNATGNFSHMVVVEEKEHLQGEPDAAGTFCTPSYFTLNSQVPTGRAGPGKPGGARWGEPP